ncbi:flagellar biosynthetic protein FliO [Methylophaga sp. 42_25_T18]|nr:flagellar biosynthetic protein FliO [Methylophaga sp. 42_25_T18]
MVIWAAGISAAETSDAITAKTLTTPTLSSGAIVETLLGLTLVLAIIILLAWLIKRTNRFQATANGEMKIIAGLPLGPRERAILLQVGEQQILVGVTAQHVQTLHILETPINTEQTKRTPIDFADKFQQILKQRSKS